MSQNIILNHQEIEHKIRRIAYQIYETFSDEKSIIIAGIKNSGYNFAEKIANQLAIISEIDVILCSVEINKNSPHEAIITSLKKDQYTNQSIVLVDDVLNSGATLIYGVKHFLEVPVKKIKTAVLIDRNHKKFPVKADFKGISLSTSLQEHIQVVFEPENNHAFLS